MADPTAPQSNDSAPGTTVPQVPSIQVPAEFAAPINTGAPAPIPGITQLPTPAPGEIPTGPDLSALEKRLRDTQAWGHRKAQEAQQLTQALNEILNHPELGRVVQGLQQSGQQPSTGASDEIKQYLKSYKAATNEEEAFTQLMEAAKSMATKDMDKKLQEREAAQNDIQMRTTTRDAITNYVRQNAQDVPPEYFWALVPEVEAITPPELENPRDRITWQINAGIQLARQRQMPVLLKLAAGLLKNDTARTAIGALVSPGSVSSMRTTPSSGDAPMNMVDQMRSMQAARMGTGLRK